MIEISFLSANPTPEQVAAYYVSERAQLRLRRLLALNAAGMLSPEEQAELDEIEQIEHIVVLVKATCGSTPLCMPDKNNRTPPGWFS